MYVCMYVCMCVYACMHVTYNHKYTNRPLYYIPRSSQSNLSVFKSCITLLRLLYGISPECTVTDASPLLGGNDRGLPLLAFQEHGHHGRAALRMLDAR